MVAPRRGAACCAPTLFFGMLALRIALGLALAYTLLVLLAWRFQDRLPLPAPRAPPPDPQRRGGADGGEIEVAVEGTARMGGGDLKHRLPPPTLNSPTLPH